MSSLRRALRTESRPHFLPVLCGLTVKHLGHSDPHSRHNALPLVMDGILELCRETPLVLLQVFHTGMRTGKNLAARDCACSLGCSRGHTWDGLKSGCQASAGPADLSMTCRFKACSVQGHVTSPSLTPCPKWLFNIKTKFGV